MYLRISGCRDMCVLVFSGYVLFFLRGSRPSLMGRHSPCCRSRNLDVMYSILHSTPSLRAFIRVKDVISFYTSLRGLMCVITTHMATERILL